MSNLLIPNTTRVPNVLLDKIMPALSGVALKVLLAIVRQTYGWNVASQQISLSRLCELTGLSRPSVISGIKELGNLVTVTRGPNNSRVENEYALNIDVATGQLVKSFDQLKNLTSQKNTPRLVKKVNSLKSIREINKTGAKTPSVSSPSRRGKKPTRPDPAAAFEQFYQAYPRHVDKAEALAAWLKLAPTPELVAEIINAVSRYAKAVENNDPKYIKHPGRWLNARRWEDEPVGNGQAKPEPKDIGNGMVEFDGLKMTLKDYERKYGARAS